MGLANVLGWTTNVVIELITIAIGVAAIVSLVHAVVQRADAFTAVDKLSKPAWVGILVAATLVIWLFGPLSLFGIIGVIAVLVYVVDVRPRTDEIQGKSWFRKK